MNIVCDNGWWWNEQSMDNVCWCEPMFSLALAPKRVCAQPCRMYALTDQLLMLFIAHTWSLQGSLGMQ